MLCDRRDVLCLIDTPELKIIPVVLQKDGMAIKPWLQFDERQGKIVGGAVHIDYKYVMEDPEPNIDELKDIFVKEAECICVTTLDDKILLPLGTDFIPSKLSADSTKK